MTTTNDTFKIELSNTCTCEDESGNPTPDCHGFCYTDARDNLAEYIDLWAAKNGLDGNSAIRIESGSIGWMQVHGWKDSQVEDLIEDLSIRSEWRLVFTFSSDYSTMTATRYSHDEPTGTAPFTFTAIESGDQD